MKKKGKLVVISGPSGAGKSTVVFKALGERDDVCFSISATTRKPRPNEVDGREYFFVDLERFQEMIDNNELLEHAEYVANRYGTPRAYVEQKIAEGMNVILDIEVQGARQVYEKMPEAIMIFVVPPSIDELPALSKQGLSVQDRSMPKLHFTTTSLSMMMPIPQQMSFLQLLRPSTVLLPTEWSILRIQTDAFIIYLYMTGDYYYDALSPRC